MSSGRVPVKAAFLDGVFFALVAVGIGGVIGGAVLIIWAAAVGSALLFTLGIVAFMLGSVAALALHP